MKTAVILAARREKDSEIPYPLMPFAEGLCLLDRTLGILRDLHFSNIVLVVGYKAEMFQKYAAEDVKLIKNEDYEFTASMGSLALAKDDIQEDFLLIESDTFNFCFRNEKNEWDNNNYENYIFELEPQSTDLIVQDIDSSLDRPNRLRKTYLWSKKIRLAIYKIITYVPKLISGNYRRKVNNED